MYIFGGFMKNFISKNWKNILITIGGIIIALNLFNKFTTPATIPQDFLEYGPNVEHDIFDTVENIPNEVEDIGSSDDIVDDVSNKTGLPNDLSKGLVVVLAGVFVIFIISAITEKPSADKKKK